MANRSHLGTLLLVGEKMKCFPTHQAEDAENNAIVGWVASVVHLPNEPVYHERVLN
jgi:hypothetical protein